MCSVTLAVAIAGTALSAYGQIQEGKAAKAQANYQAQVARNNQIIAERAAVDAEHRGKVEEQLKRRQTAQLIGQQRAGLAAHGVVVDEGSALDITSDTAEIGEFDALTIRSNAAREAAGFRARGMNFEADARLAQARGASAQRASILGAATTVADRWYNFNSNPNLTKK